MDTDHRLLSGVTLVGLTTKEKFRNELNAQFTIEGWGGSANFPETTGEFQKIAEQAIGNILVIILEPNLIEAQNFAEQSLKNGISRQQIIIGTPPNSLGHRILGRTFENNQFQFSDVTTISGPEIKFQGLPAILLQVWKKTFSLQLLNELKEVRYFPVLEILSNTLNRDVSNAATERARLTYALLNQITNNIVVRQRSIRLALMRDILFLENWELLVTTAKGIWPILDLLNEMKHVISGEGLAKTSSVEVVSVEMAELILNNVSTSEVELNVLIKDKISKLDIELRTAITMAIGACCKHFRKQFNEVA